MIDRNLKIRTVTSFVLSLIVFLMINADIFLIYFLIVFGVLSIIEFFQISKKIFLNHLLRYFLNFTFLIYIFLFCYLFLIFVSYLHLKIILFTLLFGCFASDIGGYVFGKTFKGPKLSKISPNKTLSGAAGSIIFTCLVVSALIYFFTDNFSFLILLVSAFTSISCQLGDLFFSYLKRNANIKDTGKIFPGHGGVLDRIDGVLFGLPAGFILLMVLG